MESSYRASLMDAETGASQNYEFVSDPGLFRKPAKTIVRAFMDYMVREKGWSHPPAYKLNSATKKAKKQVVMATGSLLLHKGELPFLLMISPELRATSGG